MPLLGRPSMVAAAGLVGGFALARATHRRDLGGAAFAVAGALAARDWARDGGPGTAAALGALYVAAMGGSHPLAHRLGAWPAVGVVTAAVVAASETARRR